MLRRAALLAPLVMLAGPARALPAQLAFRVVREGRDIGTHRLTLTETTTGFTARNEVDIVVRLLGITVFRFSHRYEEVWQAGRLVSFVSRQDRNGTVRNLAVRAAPAGLVVTGGAEDQRRLPPEAAPLCWWDQRRFGGRPLFDSADGRALEVRWERQALPDNQVQWKASGQAEGEARYAADGTWLGFRTRGDDGTAVEYQPSPA